MGNINELCKKLREDAGLTRKELADLFSCTPKAIKAIEDKNGGFLSLNAVKKYSEVFGEKYFDELSAPLVRYDCGEKIGELLEEKGVSLSRFAKAIRKSEGAVRNAITGCKRGNGNPYHAFDDEEIAALASYFNTSREVFKTKKIIIGRCSGRSDSGWIPMPTTLEPAPNAPKPKKTAQMICEEEKKMEYEEAMKKAKQYDALKNENERLKATLSEMTEAYNSGMERYKQVCDSLADRDAQLEEKTRMIADLVDQVEYEKTTNSVAYRDQCAALSKDIRDISEELVKYKDVALKLLMEKYTVDAAS